MLCLCNERLLTYRLGGTGCGRLSGRAAGSPCCRARRAGAWRRRHRAL